MRACILCIRERDYINISKLSNIHMNVKSLKIFLRLCILQKRLMLTVKNFTFILKGDTVTFTLCPEIYFI